MFLCALHVPILATETRLYRLYKFSLSQLASDNRSMKRSVQVHKTANIHIYIVYRNSCKWTTHVLASVLRVCVCKCVLQMYRYRMFQY